MRSQAHKKIKLSILNEILQNCEEPIKSVLPVLYELNTNNLNTIRDIVDLMIICDRHEKED